MARTKTRFTGATVSDYLEARGSGQQQADARALIAMLKKVTKHQPRMWGPSIVGFGSYRYTYESGHSGEAPRVGFAIRGGKMVIYVLAETPEQQALLGKLGPHSMGKSCLYFKRLADLDKSVLEKIVRNSIAEGKRLHG